MASAAGVSGGWAIRNRGTLGGNLANASPAADTPPALLAGDARVELSSVRGRRWLHYVAFHTGYRRTLRAPDELITRLALPAPREGAVAFYRKVGGRRGQAIAKVSLAAVTELRGGRLTGVRIALGAVAPTPVRALRAEKALEGCTLDDIDPAAASAVLQEEVDPIDDQRSTAEYRLRVAGALLQQFLQQCQGARDEALHRD